MVECDLPLPQPGSKKSQWPSPARGRRVLRRRGFRQRQRNVRILNAPVPSAYLQFYGDAPGALFKAVLE